MRNHALNESSHQAEGPSESPGGMYLETEKTLHKDLEGAILITESWTDGEAIVAAETDEFYANNRQECANDQGSEIRSTQMMLTESSSGDSELPVDTLETAPQESEAVETLQTATENEDLILENVQNFINMAYLWQTYYKEKPTGLKTVNIVPEPGKRLLLLDMDETLVHAATVNDIETNEVYGYQAHPDFYTSFVDQGIVIQIGVFIRPFLKQMLDQVAPYFQICIFTASEKMYADSILDVIDP